MGKLNLFYWPNISFDFTVIISHSIPKLELKLLFLLVLVLKRLRRRGNGLKSNPTDWEKPGIETATPGLQDIGLSPTPRPCYLNAFDSCTNIF